MAKEGKHQHLKLLVVEDPHRRRKQPDPSERTKLTLEDRAEMRTRLEGRIASLEAKPSVSPAAASDFNPSLVFRVPFKKNVNFDEASETFSRCDIKLVSREEGNVVIAFKENRDLTDFKEAVARFANPAIRPDGEQAQSTVFDVFQYIDAERMERYGRADRIGGRLEERIGSEGERIDPKELYTADIEVWHRGNVPTHESIGRLRKVVEMQGKDGNRVCDQYVGSGIALLRAKLTGSLLNDLLEVDDVAGIDLPPLPELNPFVVHQSNARSFKKGPPPPQNGPRLCVIDSGVNAEHPLLSQHVGHAETFHTKTSTAADVNGHGTSVGSVAVFGDIASCFNAKKFASDITLFSARILNEDNELDDEKLFITQVREAVQFFKAEPYRCRVFNLSFGTRFPALVGTKGKQSPWAAQIDDLARDEGVLFVLAAGNVRRQTFKKEESERILKEYPIYLFTEESGICDPGTSALGLTVGAVAHSDAPAIASMGNDDIKLAVAKIGEPSPTTRTGFGCGGAIKPDFVHDGGNLIFNRSVGDDVGLGVMAFCASAAGSLFSWHSSTSIAAPRVARAAARTWKALEGMLGHEPTPNLVRAVLAVAADPMPLRAEFGEWPDEKHLRSVGYGKPDEEIAIRSLDNDLILIHEGEIATDGFQLFEVPVPPEMAGATGWKQISCAVAFDPRTNARRKDYLAVEMRTALFRGMDPGELTRCYEAVAGDAEARKSAPRAIDDRRKCDCKPNISTVSTSTLLRQEFKTRTLKENDGDTYYLMVTSHRNWDAPEATQRFSVAVRLRANSDNLYNQVRSRVQPRIQPRLRF